MKKVELYYGENTFGTPYELAILDGKYYHRETVFNGYGKGWSKWELVNDFNGEFYIDTFNCKRLKWGWGFDGRYLGFVNRKINLA